MVLRQFRPGAFFRGERGGKKEKNGEEWLTSERRNSRKEERGRFGPLTGADFAKKREMTTRRKYKRKRVQ